MTEESDFSAILANRKQGGSRGRVQREVRVGSRRTEASRRHLDGAELRDTQVNFRTTQSFNTRLKDGAQRHGVTVSALIEAAVKAYLEDTPQCATSS